MRPNSAEEWQRLTKLYGEMSDGQVQELAESYSDLTEFAQPILRDELKKRGMDDPQAPATEPPLRRNPQEEGDGAGEAKPVEYSWMVLLCQCDSNEHAYQLQEVLYREGIDSWVDNEKSPGRHGLRYPEVLVAPDQLEKARRIAAQPIPQGILNDAKNLQSEDFVAPRCPRCKSEEVLLVTTEPTNQWQCDECGAKWSDRVPVDSSARSQPTS